jgi:WD40 repeat protein
VLWNLDTAQQELERQGFANLAFGTDRSGRCLLVKNDAPAIEFWELAGCRETRNLPRAWYPALGNASRVEISPDNRLLAISSYDGFELWDLARLRRLVARPGPHSHLEFDRQGNLILANPTGIFRWPRHDDLRPAEGDTPAKLTVTFGPPSRVASIGVPSSLAQGNPDDVILFEAHGVWQSASLRGNHKPVKLHPSGDPRKAAVSPDERFAVIANWDLTGGSVWDLQTGTRVRNLDTGRHAMLEFSPDGRWLATTPGGVQLWNTNDWSLARELHAEGTTPSGLGIAFSPDSRVLVIGQPNGELRIVDPATGKDWARIMNPSQATPSFIAISPDNRTLVTLSCDHMAPVRVWNLVELRRALSELDLNWPADVLRPAPAASDQVAELEVVLQFGAWQAYQRAHDVLRTLRAAQSP